MSDSTLFVHGEVELAEAVGIAVRRFQKKRAKEMRQDVDWGLNLMRVAYAKNAVPRILDSVCGRAIEPQELTALLEKSCLETAEKSAPAIVEATVRRFFMNPHLMEVELPSKALVNVRVKTTANFLRGMQVPIREAAAGNWILARKLPRFPGRW